RLLLPAAGDPHADTRHLGPVPPRPPAGLARARTLGQADGLTAANRRGTLVRNRQREARAATGNNRSVVSRLADAQQGLAHHRNLRRIVAVVLRIFFRILIRTPHRNTVRNRLAGIGVHVCSNHHRDRAADRDDRSSRHRGRITRTGNCRVGAVHRVTRDGDARARTLGQADGLTAANRRGTLVRNRQREARAATGNNRSVVSRLADAQQGLAHHRNLRRVVAVVLRVFLRILIRTPYRNAVRDRLAGIGVHVGSYHRPDRAADRDDRSGRHRGRITRTGNRRVGAVHRVTLDGDTRARTLGQADGLTAANRRGTLVCNRQREARAATGNNRSVVSRLADAQQ